MSEQNRTETPTQNEHSSETSPIHQIVTPGSDHNSSSEQGDETHQQSRQSNSSGGSISGRCSICWEPLREAAIVFPCGHKFDLACIRRWTTPINNNEHTLKTCPVCRNPIVELRHSFDDDGNFQSETIQVEGDRSRATGEERNAEVEARLERGRRVEQAVFQRNQARQEQRAFIYGDQESGDEDVTPEMSARQTYAANERLRLRNLPETLLTLYRALIMDIPADHENDIPGVKRNISLLVKRADLVTISCLSQRITLTTRGGHLIDIDNDLPESLKNEVTNSHLQQYKKATNEFKKALPSLEPGLLFTNASTQIELPKSHSNRNIRAHVERIVELTEIKPVPDDVDTRWTLTWQKTLREEGPACADGDSVEEAYDDPTSYGKSMTDKANGQLAAEIQGILGDIERKFPPLPPDRATTMLREPYVEAYPCSYCQGAHKSGDCQLGELSWEVIEMDEMDFNG